MRTDYPKLFAELFCCNLSSLHEYIPKIDARRKKPINRGAKGFGFTEKLLEIYIKDETESRRPTECPQIKVSGRGVDYEIEIEGRTVAGCELKGPLRRKGQKALENTYDDIVADIAKQRRRAKDHPLVEHYVGILVCGVKSEADVQIRERWLPWLEEDTTACLHFSAIYQETFFNDQMQKSIPVSACILRVVPRTHYPCGCLISSARPWGQLQAG